MLVRLSRPNPLALLAGHPVVPRRVAVPALSRRAFTLPELLVVLLIVGIVSALAVSIALPAYNHREVSAAGRVLQGAIVGAQSRAVQLGRPCGIRLVPDPAYPVQWTTAGTIDPTAILAYRRVIPLESAPDYQEGRCTPISSGTLAYLGSAGLSYSPPTIGPGSTGQGLILAESLANPRDRSPNAPTSWFWNIRVGDKVQLNDAGNWYTVIGPLVIWPGATDPKLRGNSELFVNVGQPGPIGAFPGLVPMVGGQPVEFLMLVNGVDDNRNGMTDEGFDGCDNNGNGLIDLADALEWQPNTIYLPGPPPQTLIFGETEAWLGSPSSTQVDTSYTIRRRPAPSQNARGIDLPSSMVIDATTWSGSRERSRLPVNPLTGLVDVVVNADGTVVPTTVYSSPSIYGMDGAFLHFWLAERQDLAPPGAAGLPASAPYALPIPSPGSAENSSSLPGPYLKGEYAVLSLSARTGNLTVSSSPPVLYDATIGYNAQVGTWRASNPFLPSEQGAAGN